MAKKPTKKKKPAKKKKATSKKPARKSGLWKGKKPWHEEVADELRECADYLLENVNDAHNDPDTNAQFAEDIQHDLSNVIDRLGQVIEVYADEAKEEADDE